MSGQSIVAIEINEHGGFDQLYGHLKTVRTEHKGVPHEETYFSVNKRIEDVVQRQPSLKGSCPSLQKHRAGYFEAMKAFPGRIIGLKTPYLRSLLNGSDQMRPGSIAVSCGGKSDLIREQVEADFLRVNQITFNERPIYKQSLVRKEKLQDDRECLKHHYIELVKAFDGDLKLTRHVSKLFTQTANASLAVWLFKRVTNEELGFCLLSGGNKQVAIVTSEEMITVHQEFNFRVMEIATETVTHHTTLCLTINVPKESLKKGQLGVGYGCAMITPFTAV